MKKEPPFDPVKDFTPIVRIANSVHTLVSRTSLSVSNVRELIAYAKANPGKVTYGSSGFASFPFLGGKLMERAAGIEMIHVPFSGDAPRDDGGRFTEPRYPLHAERQIVC